MIKYLFRLIISSTSLVALLLVANTAMAVPQIDSVVQAANQPVSLNIISPALEVIHQGNNLRWDHLGCSCAVCTAGFEQTK